MGGLYSRLFRKHTTRDQLEDIEKKIKGIHEFRVHTQQRQKRFVGSLIAYSVVLYVIGALVFYFYWFPSDLSKQILYSLPLVLFPLLVWLLKEFVHWYYQRKLKNNESQLTELLRKKRKLLDEVMEKETYKVAHEILEKFDPDQLRKNNKENDVLAGNPESGPPGPPMPRPILPRERTFFDKLIEYLVGDGPTARFALICRQCQSHNGMALQEEFEYIAFRCCYCYFWNPARKQRPSAPRLPDQFSTSSTPPLLKSDDDGKLEEQEGSLSEGETEEEELSVESEKKDGEFEEMGGGEKMTEDLQTKEPKSTEAKAVKL